MRLIGSFSSSKDPNPYELSHFLKSHGIENECQEIILPDQEPLYRIWVIDEENYDKALTLVEQYKQNPTKLSFSKKENGDQKAKSVRNKNPLSPSPFGKISLFVILLCVLTFLASIITDSMSVPPKIPGVVEALVLKGVTKAFIFDYPHYFELRDLLLKYYPKEAIEKKEPPNDEAQKILSELKNTPFWNGFYDRFVNHFHNSNYPLGYSGPMFEKISQGQIWRLFTPAFLHYGFLHIFFNLLWFILLGNQIEFRLGAFRTIFLLSFISLVSNSAQYLMSGSFFMGLSGVVVGLAGFIFARQQVAPWEGYLLQRTTLIFLAIFIFGIFALQLGFFAMQLLGKTELSVPIANTAHLVGGFVGYLFGRLRLFALHVKEE